MNAAIALRVAMEFWRQEDTRLSFVFIVCRVLVRPQIYVYICIKLQQMSGEQTGEARIRQELMAVVDRAPWYRPWRVKKAAAAAIADAATLILEGSIAAQTATAALLKERGQPVIPEYIGLSKSMTISSTAKWEGVIGDKRVVVTRSGPDVWSVSVGSAGATGIKIEDMLDLISILRVCGVVITRDTLNRNT